MGRIRFNGLRILFYFSFEFYGTLQFQNLVCISIGTKNFLRNGPVSFEVHLTCQNPATFKDRTERIVRLACRKRVGVSLFCQLCLMNVGPSENESQVVHLPSNKVFIPIGLSVRVNPHSIDWKNHLPVTVTARQVNGE